MKISLPDERTYYAASRNEPHRLMCWIPYRELQAMVNEGKASDQVLEDYPDGLEIEVTDEAFSEAGIDIGLSPDLLLRGYKELLNDENVSLPDIIQGEWLEEESNKPMSTEVMSTGGISTPLKDEGPGSTFSRGFGITESLPRESLPADAPSRPRAPKMTEGDKPFAVFSKIRAIKKGQ